jgi:hypothetical protein
MEFGRHDRGHSGFRKNARNFVIKTELSVLNNVAVP